MHHRTLITRIAISITGIAISAATLGIGGSTAAASGSLRTPEPRPIGGFVAPTPAPQPSTTCERNRQCGALRWARELVGGTYSGWQSTDPRHGHEHGVCTWPWE